ncbi:SRPBCC family protein [Thauera linaloolentis]|uniref:Polyketide cyclase/dehydrase and lipid transport n=1 Tax=Thauera linaloolentis (strain DSM 12138 / JCM 21573 / CCUG 41526 / CIP 105981 / IAM 15112 / NBRC 102519 / 47Lol) TaxID=1123367 RepID=N6YY12_THAL4|nr:SRPBCC family protein [Thauera linaloolentis]ENO87287.1 polyketide cyclase/dehydrase and lipid transport [Thauera linaloolentis 47Lol = DSM 12138]MCM8566736.1 SRPBCC family protein [Thauera linaloolentis]
MHQIVTHHDFDAPAATLWAYLADFANIERWWPTARPEVQIERVELEGEGIGLVRHIYNKGYSAPVSERLDFQDPETMSYRLSIVGQRPAGLTEYQATGRIEALGDGRSRLHYHSVFATASGKPDEAEAFLRMAYALMFEGLAEAAARDA